MNIIKLKKTLGLVLVFIISFGSISSAFAKVTTAETEHLVIVGGGLIGAMQAYQEYKLAKSAGRDIAITIYEQNQKLSQTTVMNIVPSLTPDEILAVVPAASELQNKLAIPFNQPGGIQVTDVAGLNNNKTTSIFLDAVTKYNNNPGAEQQRTNSLLQLGKQSMQLWDKIYHEADPELRAIMREANYKPCLEPKQRQLKIGKGYRIDLIFDVANAAEKARGMRDSYHALGYSQSQLIDPETALQLDSSLQQFVNLHASTNSNGKLVWHNDAVALYRPGGCIDTSVLLPKLYDYLAQQMGAKFALKFNSRVTNLVIEQLTDNARIVALEINGKRQAMPKHSSYVFCPGESLQTLTKLKLKTPAYSGFAGPSLRLYIPKDMLKSKQASIINHCMEVHKEGVVLAWQARAINDQLFIGVAGTKAYYADQTPNITEAFATERNILQLNMIANVYPEIVEELLKATNINWQPGQELNGKHLDALVKQGIAKRWVGTRAVAYDGYPTLGQSYTRDGITIINATQVTHAGSGGGSFAPILVDINSRLRAAISANQTDNLDAELAQIASFADARR